MLGIQNAAIQQDVFSPSVVVLGCIMQIYEFAAPIKVCNRVSNKEELMGISGV